MSGSALRSIDPKLKIPSLRIQSWRLSSRHAEGAEAFVPRRSGATSSTCRIEGKFNLVSYARNDLWRSSVGKNKTKLFSLDNTEIRSIFGTNRNYEEYHFRYNIKNRSRNDRRTAEEWTRDMKYSWVEDGERQYPTLLDIANVRG